MIENNNSLKIEQEKPCGKLNSLNEFEHHSIPALMLKSWKNFVGIYGGRNTAGTKFVLGLHFLK